MSKPDVDEEKRPASKAAGDKAAKKVTELKRQVKALQASLAEAEATIISQSAWIDRAREVIMQTDLRAVGFQGDHLELFVIEQLIPMADEKEATEYVAHLRQQEGCLGGRPVRAHRGTWEAQVFWEPEVLPATVELFGLWSSVLPEGQNYRILPPGQRVAFGCRPILPK